MSLDTRGEVSQFTFNATQLSGGSATTFGSSSGGRTLLRERLALGFGFPSEIGQQCRGFDDFISRGFSSGFSGFGFQQRLRAAVFDFESFFVHPRGILTDDAHVTLGTLNFLFEAGGCVLVRHRLALFTTDCFVERYARVFDFDQTATPILP